MPQTLTAWGRDLCRCSGLLVGVPRALGPEHGRGRVNPRLQQLSIQHKQHLGMRSLLFWESKGKHSCICSCNHGLVLRLFMFRNSCWNIYQLGYRNQLWLLRPKRIHCKAIFLQKWRKSVNCMSNVAPERKLGISGILNTGELRGSLFGTNSRMDCNSPFPS